CVPPENHRAHASGLRGWSSSWPGASGGGTGRMRAVCSGGEHAFPAGRQPYCLRGRVDLHHGGRKRGRIRHGGGVDPRGPSSLGKETKGGDPLSDLSSASSSSLSIKGSAARLKLQRELLSRSGVFFQKVQEAAVRRMEPTANLGAVQEASQRSVMTRFLERYGGFKDQRVWGLVQWQLAQIFDLLASEQVEGAKDVLALLMLMVDQTVLDSGHHELGWILSLQEDPPSQVFTAPQHSSSSSVRPCSHLCDPKWLAVALSYVKEMETLSSRRSEVAKGKAGGYGSEAVPKTAAPPLSRKQQRAKLWAERKASAQPKG
ncbi:Ttn, partial [Symbiodinium microadriaticum]